MLTHWTDEETKHQLQQRQQQQQYSKLVLPNPVHAYQRAQYLVNQELSAQIRETLQRRLKSYALWDIDFNTMIANVTTTLMKNMVGPHDMMFINLYLVARQARSCIGDLVYEKILSISEQPEQPKQPEHSHQSTAMNLKTWIQTAFPICSKLLFSSQHQQHYQTAMLSIEQFAYGWYQKLLHDAMPNKLLAQLRKESCRKMCVLSDSALLSPLLTWDGDFQDTQYDRQVLVMMDGSCEEHKHSMDTCPYWTDKEWISKGFHVRQFFPTRDKMTLQTSWACFMLFLNTFIASDHPCLSHIHVTKLL